MKVRAWTSSNLTRQTRTLTPNAPRTVVVHSVRTLVTVRPPASLALSSDTDTVPHLVLGNLGPNSSDMADNFVADRARIFRGPPARVDGMDIRPTDTAVSDLELDVHLAERPRNVRVRDKNGIFAHGRPGFEAHFGLRDTERWSQFTVVDT
jgi:hypothetical protein